MVVEVKDLLFQLLLETAGNHSGVFELGQTRCLFPNRGLLVEGD